MKKLPKLALLFLVLALVLTACNQKKEEEPDLLDPIEQPTYTLADSATSLPEGMPGLLDYLPTREGYFKVNEIDLVYLIISLGQEAEEGISLRLKDLIKENSVLKINLETELLSESGEGMTASFPQMVLVFEEDFEELEINLNEDESLDYLDLVYHFAQATYQEVDEAGDLILHLSHDEEGYFQVFELTPLQAEILPHLKLQEDASINIFFVTEESKQPIIVELQIPGK